MNLSASINNMSHPDKISVLFLPDALVHQLHHTTDRIRYKG